MDRVNGKVVIVTGGGSGIGRATCLLLAKEGGIVAVTDINDKGGQETVDEITKAGGQAKFWHLDTTDESQVEQVVSDVEKVYGRINGLVNNAGVGGTSRATHEMPLSEFDAVMNVNVRGVFLCSKHVIPSLLKDGGGSVVNISSVAGLIGTSHAVGYCASKGAVRLMTKSDALTYAKKNIRFNSVHPAFTYTPMVQELLTDRNVPREKLEAVFPMGHMGEPEDVAYGILYLISDESKFLTGSELVIDGGLSAS